MSGASNPNLLHVNSVKTAAGLLALTAVSFLLTGYRYGVDDHIVHIPRLLHLLDSGLYAPDDLFIQAQATHYSYFWRLVAPLAHIIPLPPLFFALTFLFRFLYAVAVWRLAMRLFGWPAVAWLAAAALLAEKITLGFYILPDKSLLDRAFALPLVLVALERYLAGRRLLPYLLLGLVANVHVLSALYALPLLVAGGLAEVRSAGASRLLTGVGTFVAGGLPIFWWRLQSPGDLPLLLPDPQWLAIAKAAVVTLLNITVIDMPHGVVLLSALGFLAGYLLAQQRLTSTPEHGLAQLWMAVTLALVLVAIIFTDLWPISIVLQLQLIRAGQWLMIFGMLYMAHLLWDLWQNRRLPTLAAAGGTGALVVGIFGFLPLLALLPALIPQRMTWWLRNGALVGGQVAALALALLYLGAKLQAWPFLFSPPQDQWWQAQEWVRQHTPQEAVVLVPPHFRGAEMGSEFRVVAQRSPVATYAEGGEASFNRAFALAWAERMRDLTNGAFSLADPGANTLERMREGFDSLSEADLRRVAARHGASYLLLEEDRRLSWAPRFNNGRYAVYALVDGALR
ncbi:MAG: hypothetical protein HYY02_00280 [Chloroflexi bacterium]|nr:hypothetical protein [Chloroflexota bacterium]